MRRPGHFTKFLCVSIVTLACNGQATDDDDSLGSGPDMGAPACENAALEYHGVCFRAHTLASIGYQRPLDLDGRLGDEFVELGSGVRVHRFDGDGFALVGEAPVPDNAVSGTDAIAGEFDEVAGLDLVISEPGEWAALYHLDDDGAPGFVEHTAFLPSQVSSSAFKWPVAVGPDANGRWRVLAHYDNAGEPVLYDPLSLWQIDGTVFEQERLELAIPSCGLELCAGGDFDGDGRRDAVCSFVAYEDACPNEPPEDRNILLLLLTQADGTMSSAAYPTSDGGTSFIAADLDGDAMSDILARSASDRIWYRLGDGLGGLGPVVWVENLPPASLNWGVVSVGDLDGDGGTDVILGDLSHSTGIVFPDLTGAPSSYEMLDLTGTFGFPPSVGRPIDANADGVVDLPIVELPEFHAWILVSEKVQ